MKSKKHSFSNEDLRTLVITCGGVAFLIALAVFIGPKSSTLAINPADNTAVAGDTRSIDASYGSNYNTGPAVPVIPPTTSPYRLQGKTDITWKQTRTLTPGWEQPGFNDSAWAPAVDESGPIYFTSGGGGGNHTYTTSVSSASSRWASAVGIPKDTAAHWIWYHDSRSYWNGDTATVYFRKTFTAMNVGAKIIIDADDIYTAYLNGAVISTGNDWHTAKTVNVQLTPGTTYTLAVSVRNTGGPGGLFVEVDQSPILNLSAISVAGAANVNWSVQNARDCAVNGPGVSVSSDSGTKNFILETYPATYTLTCAIPAGAQAQKTIQSPSWWYAVYGGLPSFGMKNGNTAAQDPSNRVKDGWPAPLGCQQNPGNSESPCYEAPVYTTYAVLSAFERANPTNGNKSFLTAKGPGGRYEVSRWDAKWIGTVTPTPNVVVPAGSAVTLEWACQPTQINYFEDNCGFLGLSSCTESNGTISLFTSSQGTNFSTGGVGRGLVTVTPPTGGQTYTLRCVAANGVISPPVKVNVNKEAPYEPTLTIQGLLNGAPIVGAITVGQPIVVHATFAADTDDTILGAAINGGVNDSITPACQGVPGGCPTPVFSNGNKNAVLDYAITPLLAGTYTFWPAAKTSFAEAAGYVNYGNVSTSIVVNCPVTTPNCAKLPKPLLVCPPGSAPDNNGVCIPTDICSNMPGNQSSVPVNCHQSGTQCLANSGYMVQGDKCVATGVIYNFTANPPRVRKGGTATLAWSVGNMTSCGITGSDGTTPVAQSAAAGSDGNHQVSVVVQQTTNYKLSCTDGVNNRSSEKLISLIPSYQEI
jgi:hypothetical protein